MNKFEIIVTEAKKDCSFISLLQKKNHSAYPPKYQEDLDQSFRKSQLKYEAGTVIQKKNEIF